MDAHLFKGTGGCPTHKGNPGGKKPPRSKRIKSRNVRFQARMIISLGRNPKAEWRGSR